MSPGLKYSDNEYDSEEEDFSEEGNYGEGIEMNILSKVVVKKPSKQPSEIDVNKHKSMRESIDDDDMFSSGEEESSEQEDQEIIILKEAVQKPTDI